MKVKCINLYCEIQNRDMGFALTLGNEYVVLEMLIRSNRTAYRLEDDTKQGPAIYSSAHFEVIDGYLPSNWFVKQYDSISFDLSPIQWQADGFWENFYELEPQAYEIYKKQRELILEESKVRLLKK